MNILNKLKKIAIFFDNKQNSLFSYPVMKQERYMNSLKEPRDNIERSYNQYRCQMKLRGRVGAVFINIVSLPMLIVYYFKKSDLVNNSNVSDGVFISGGIPENVIPTEVKNEFKIWTIVNSHRENLSDSDKFFFRRIIKKYPFSWHFLLKCLIKIRFYSYEIKAHMPRAIVVCSEYSFTSSILTEYCRVNGIWHIDVMHGEKLFFMRDSFFCFDRCYVWDKVYVDLFLKLHADKQQFIIAVPDSMKVENQNFLKKTVDFTYYLGGENQEILKNIFECLKSLKEKGYCVAVRPHPRYSDINMIRNLFKTYVIEDIDKIDIKTSILRSKHIVSLYSTVLNQAYHMGENIIIDDVTNQTAYYQLKELGYVVLNYRHELLSQIMRDKE